MFYSPGRQVKNSENFWGKKRMKKEKGRRRGGRRRRGRRRGRRRRKKREEEERRERERERERNKQILRKTRAAHVENGWCPCRDTSRSLCMFNNKLKTHVKTKTR